jgi:hypothetical protein
MNQEGKDKISHSLISLEPGPNTRFIGMTNDIWKIQGKKKKPSSSPIHQSVPNGSKRSTDIPGIKIVMVTPE